MNNSLFFVNIDVIKERTKMDYTEKVTAFNKKKREINDSWIKKGVLILDPENTYIDEDVEIGEDSTIYPNVFILKGSKVGKNVTILPNSFLSNASPAASALP